MMKLISLLVLSQLLVAPAFAAPTCADIFSLGSLVQVAHGKINDGRLLKIDAKVAPSSKVPQLIEAQVAVNAGAALVKLDVRLPNGHVFNMLAPRGPMNVEKRFRRAQAAGDAYASNSFFLPGSTGIMWPMQNRLLGQLVAPDVIEAKVMGQTVRMPLNFGRGEGQIVHHIHGTLFDQAPRETVSVAPTMIRSTFGPEAQNGFWTGKSKVTVTQGLRDGGFEMMLKAKNIGKTPVPFGAAAHPYFMAPSGDPAAIRIVIPAKKLVEIDNYSNVLPTGRILDIEPGSNYDFNHAEGVPLAGRYFDNLFVDLELDKDGYAYAEFIDVKAKLRVRLTALTKNVIGIQMFAPKPGVNPAQGVFAALEMVTHLPDPREELWGDIPTGMRLLQPGQTGSYGYRIDVLPLEK